MLIEFIREHIEPKAQEPSEAQPRQKRFRRLRISLKPPASSALGKMPLNEIATEHVLGYADARSTRGLSVGTVNRELRALRRCLRLAVEWEVLEKAPKVAMAGKEVGRERVVSEAELSQYTRLSEVAVNLSESAWLDEHRLD
jgi:hypothetical protein